MASARRERQRANRARGVTMQALVDAAAPLYAPRQPWWRRAWRWLSCPACWGVKDRVHDKVLERFG